MRFVMKVGVGVDRLRGSHGSEAAHERPSARTCFSLLLLVALASSSAWGGESEADAVISGLQDRASDIASLECVVQVHLLSRGAHGRVLQEKMGRRHFWCDRSARRVRDADETSGESLLWDGKNMRVKRTKGGKSTEEEFPPTVMRVEDVWPRPNYIFFPDLLFAGREWEIARRSTNKICLVGRHRSRDQGDPGQQRLEVDVDMGRKVVLQVRSYSASGMLLERIRMKSFKKVGNVWLPTLVKERRNRQRNVIDITISFQGLSGKSIDSSVWEDL